MRPPPANRSSAGDDSSGGATLRACPSCGLVQTLPPMAQAPRGTRARCARCRGVVHDPRARMLHDERVLATAIAALVLYPVAISQPILRIERLGLTHEASIWEGSVGLLARGELFVGLVVLVCSMVLPLAKLLAIVALTGSRRLLPRAHRPLTYRLVEHAGRWGMLDVLLIAVLVAWVKMGDLVEMHAGPAALAFTLCVLASLLASAWFDPHSIWDEEPTT